MPVTFHEEISEIFEYIDKNKLDVVLFSNEGEFIQREKSFGLKRYYEDTFRYLGAYPENYLFIGDFSDLESMDVESVVSKVRNGKLDALVFFGYNDGGIYSISSTQQIFQKNLKDLVDWDCFR